MPTNQNFNRRLFKQHIRDRVLINVSYTHACLMPQDSISAAHLCTGTPAMPFCLGASENLHGYDGYSKSKAPAHVLELRLYAL